MKLILRLLTAVLLATGIMLISISGDICTVSAVSNVSKSSTRYVIPCGTPFGVKLYTDGVVVVGTDEIVFNGKHISPADDAGIIDGDVIYSINGKKINSNEELSEIINSSGGRTISVQIKRDDRTFTTELTPAKTNEKGDYKAGLWVRDSCAGIGTMTFYEPQSGCFAALGHGICDADTCKLLPSSDGDIVNSTIESITKGVKGTPGGLNAYFTDDEPIGRLVKNTEQGVYGTLEYTPKGCALPVANRNEVNLGKASILSTIEGEIPILYDIEITSINLEACNNTKNMVIEIKDKDLLEKTGGIVQGMSGSPIMQNGYVVGAVTHVFVNDPEKGYAIFADTMLNEIDNMVIGSLRCPVLEIA